MDNREVFYELIKSKGYKSFRDFCKAVNIAPGNLHTNVKGLFELSMDRAFLIANTLEVPIDTILDIFYAEKMRENKKFS